MNPIAIIASSVALSCVASAVVATTIHPPQDSRAPQIAPPADDARLVEIIRRCDAFDDRLSQIEAAETRRAVATTAEAGELARLVEAYLARREGHDEEDRAASSGDRNTAFESYWAQLSSPPADWEKVEALWNEANEAGVLDQLVQAFEERAKAHPDDANVQTQLGAAYLQKVRRTPDFTEKATLAQAADDVFDKALAIDPQNWQARFSKAVSLSFWPPIMGKGAEAIEHFETLIGQQTASGQRQPEHAMTYLYLGNLYEQQGKSAEAQRTWKNGYDLFPGNGELAAKVK